MGIREVRVAVHIVVATGDIQLKSFIASRLKTYFACRASQAATGANVNAGRALADVCEGGSGLAFELRREVVICGAAGSSRESHYRLRLLHWAGSRQLLDNLPVIVSVIVQ